MLRRSITVRTIIVPIIAVVLMVGCGSGQSLATPTRAPILAPTSATTARATLPPIAIATSPSNNAANVVTNGVMAKDVQGDGFDPVGISDTFDQSQAIFHAVIAITHAPADTVFKVVWSQAGGNSNMGETELKSEGTRNLHFTFKPDAGHLPAGEYQLDIYVNGKYNRTLRFTVTGESAQATTPPSGPSGLIRSVTTAQGIQGESKDPVNPTLVFQPSSVFHAVVAIENAPAQTTFTAKWYVVDVGSASAPNTLVDSVDLTTDGTRNLDFDLKPATKWPVGTYRVDILVNGTLDQSVEFSVQ